MKFGELSQLRELCIVANKIAASSHDVSWFGVHPEILTWHLAKALPQATVRVALTAFN